ncbi:MAG: hypothetical protein WCQ86_00420 [Bacteroidaceae bacterium]
MEYLSHSKIKQWFPVLLGIMISIGMLTACNNSPQKQDINISAKNVEEEIRTDSIENHSFFTNKDLPTLKEKNPEQWELVTNLLSIYFQARYEQETILGEIKLPLVTINQQLAKKPNLWKENPNLTGVTYFSTLSKQARQLADFPTASSYEKNCQKALLDFFDLYLIQKADKSVYQYSKSKSLATALEQENSAWLHLIEAEAKMGEILLQLNYPDSFYHLGLQKAKFLASLQKRHCDSDKETYLALSSSNYNPIFSVYVTWAETKSEYAKLAIHINQQYQNQPALCRNLTKALNIEQSTWFSLVKARDAVQEGLYGNAQKVYSSNSRKLKNEHIKDLQSTFERLFQES